MTEEIRCGKALCKPKDQARVLYRQWLMCIKKPLSHRHTDLLGKNVFQYRINYFLHQFRATSPWYLSSQHLACHTQGWDIRIKWMTVGVSYQAAERAFAIHRTTETTAPVRSGFRNSPGPSGDEPKLKAMRTSSCNSDFWRQGGRWGQVSLNRTLLNTSQLL